MATRKFRGTAPAVRGDYFAVACPSRELNRQGLKLDRDAHGNSYAQVVGFTRR
jgi:hypothetical protein